MGNARQVRQSRGVAPLIAEGIEVATTFGEEVAAFEAMLLKNES